MSFTDGGGAHTGSASGKNLCTFLHSYTCAGGITEDADWKGCPNDYIPGLISASGFEQTLQQTDFGPPHSNTRLQSIPQPSFSTPQLAGQIITEHSLETPHPGFNQNPNPQTFPRQSEFQPGSTPMSAPHQPLRSLQPSSQNVTLDPSALPHHVELDRPQQQQASESVGVALGSGHQQGDLEWTQRLRPRQEINYNEDVPVDLSSSAERGQVQAANLRATNQSANQAAAQLNNGQGFPFNIKNLRADSNRRREVEEDIQVIRDDIPSLHAAQSAPLHRDDYPPPVQPRVQSAPYQYMGYQLPGVQPLAPQPTTQTGLHLPRGDRLVGGQHNPQTGGPPNQQSDGHVQGRHAQQPAQQQYQSQQPMHQQQTDLGFSGQQAQNGGQTGNTQQPAYQQTHWQVQHPQQSVQQQYTPHAPQQSIPQQNPRLASQSTHLPASSPNGQLQTSQPQLQHQAGAIPGEEVYEYITDHTGRRFLVKSSSIHQPQLPPVGGHLRGGQSANQNRSQQMPPSNLQQNNNFGTGEMMNNGYDTFTGPDGNQYQVRRSSVQPHLSGHTNYQHGLPGQLPQSHPAQFQQHQSSFLGQADQTAWQSQDRERGRTSFLEDSRATKKLKLCDYLKRCPVKWAKDTNLRNMNLSAFGYASMAELEAGLSSKSDPVSQEELLARIRHAKNVFEVCCLNSKDSDFKAYGWILARDYAAKVSNKVDHGIVTWEEMPPGVQTADLVSAQCDYPRPMPKQDDQIQRRDKKEQDTRLKKLCSTYNNCTTEYKCDYEVTNTDKDCLRIHECSWCRKNLKQGFRHQESRCKKKEAKGE